MGSRWGHSSSAASAPTSACWPGPPGWGGPGTRGRPHAARLPGQAQPGPDDLLIVVRAGAPAEAQAALGQVDALLARRRAAVDHAARPRRLAGAAQQLA